MVFQVTKSDKVFIVMAVIVKFNKLRESHLQVFIQTINSQQRYKIKSQSRSPLEILEQVLQEKQVNQTTFITLVVKEVTPVITILQTPLISDIVLM